MDDGTETDAAEGSRRTAPLGCATPETATGAGGTAAGLRTEGDQAARKRRVERSRRERMGGTSEGREVTGDRRGGTAEGMDGDDGGRVEGEGEGMSVAGAYMADPFQ